jgi:hypothetical protein
MKKRLIVALLGLAIGFALPTFAQQTNKPDPQLRERLIARIKAHTDALDKNDATAVAANFTEDAVNVEQDGPTFGREEFARPFRVRYTHREQFIEILSRLPHIFNCGLR